MTAALMTAALMAAAQSSATIRIAVVQHSIQQPATTFMTDAQVLFNTREVGLRRKTSSP
jgi:hypothetical protein